MIKTITPLIIAIIVIFFGAKIRRKKELENKNIVKLNNNISNASAVSSAVNKNLKTGDALNFNSYDIPEWKGYHFEAGKGYVRDRKDKNDDMWFSPADGIAGPCSPGWFSTTDSSIFDDE